MGLSVLSLLSLQGFGMERSFVNKFGTLLDYAETAILEKYPQICLDASLRM